MGHKDRERSYNRAKAEGEIARALNQPRDSNPYARERGPTGHMMHLHGFWNIGWDDAETPPAPPEPTPDRSEV